MSYTILNNIINIAEYNIDTNRFQEIQKKGPYQIFGRPDDAIAFTGEKYSQFFALIDQYLSKNKHFQNTISKKYFIELLIPKIKDHKAKNTLFSDNSFAQYIESIEVSEYIILRDVFGIILKSPKSVCRLGEYNIYYWPATRSLIEKKFNFNSKTLWLNNKHNYLIEVSTKAMDKDKAIELANEKFALFTNLLHIHIGRCDNKHIISVLSLELLPSESVYCFNKNRMILSQSYSSTYIEPIPIDDPYYQANKDFQIFWDFISKPIDNKYKKRLLLSIKWLGEAYRERSLQNGFLKAAISLEILFTYNEKTIINQSILSQISESIALILGSNPEQRIAIEKDIKNLYSIRSSIAHAGNSEVEESKYIIICNYSRAVLVSLLNDSKYDVDSIENLFKVLKHTKYS